jgi:hypothetical protein
MVSRLQPHSLVDPLDAHAFKGRQRILNSLEQA